MSVDTLELRASGLSGSIAFWIQGDQRANGGLGLPLYDGLLCAGGAITRLGFVTVGGATSQMPPPSSASVSVRGNVPASGGTRVYPVLYRNQTPALGPPATANTPNGLARVGRP